MSSSDLSARARAPRLPALALVAASALGLVACSKDAGEDLHALDAGPLSFTDEKSKLYNLIGRWYPVTEVNRLKDPTLTPEQWCERPPIRVNVLSDQVDVYCEKNTLHSASIARVVTSTAPGEITLMLRARQESPLKRIRFRRIAGPMAVVEGSPCFAKAEPHQRFPEYELYTRNILGPRRCSQLEVHEEPPLELPKPELE